MDVRHIGADESEALRREVLRGGRADLPLGDGDGATHVGVFVDDRLVATGNLRAEAPEWRSDGPAWRIRGMATDPDRRGLGLGGLVLTALLDLAAERGGGLVWCHARVPAQRFYERHGFSTYGDPWFEPPPFGPHVVMRREID